MSYFPNFSVTYKDSPDKDAFGRLRVSDPATILVSQFQYDLQPLVWESVLGGSGTVTHLPNESSCRMRVAVAADEVIRQSRMYARYRAGKSLSIAQSMIFGAATENVRKRAGYFDAQNGIFLEQNGIVDVAIVRRTFTSGSAVDNRVVQASWNIDTFDGTGPSQVTLDLSKAQILMIDLQWLGVGRVRVGFDVDGIFHPAHEFLNANNLSTVYMTTANLPSRYEITATGAIAGNTDLIQICTAIISEGGFEVEHGIVRSVANGVTPIAVTTRRPILSIRPKLTFNSLTNRTMIFPEGLELTAATNNSYWELVQGGTLTDASWTSVGSNSFAESDIAASAISGGEVIASGFVLSGGGSARLHVDGNLISRWPLTLNIAGDASIPLSLVCTSFTGTSSVTGELEWRELI